MHSRHGNIKQLSPSVHCLCKLCWVHGTHPHLVSALVRKCNVFLACTTRKPTRHIPTARLCAKHCAEMMRLAMAVKATPNPPGTAELIERLEVLATLAPTLTLGIPQPKP